MGLGSNLGDRLGYLRAALDAMSKVAHIERVSPVYETEPVGPSQPRFYNAAVLADVPLEPAAWLTELLRIEAELGRERRERWGPRTLDLDLLIVDGVTCDTPHLTLPHPRLTERAFALVPLLDVLPDAPYPRPLERLDRVADEGWWGVVRSPQP